MSSIYRFFVKNPLLILILLISSVGFFLYNIQNFALDASSDSLVLEGDENLSYYNKIRKDYGSDDYLVISYQVSNDLLNPRQLNHLQRLRDELRSLNSVKSVTTILDVPLFRSPPLSLLDLATKDISIEKGNADLNLAKIELASSPIYGKNLVSEDAKTTAILVNLKQNESFNNLRNKRDQLRLKKAANELSQNELIELSEIESQVIQNNALQNESQAKTIQSIRDVLDKYRDQATLFLGGLPMITTDIIEYIDNDLIVFSLAVIGLMTLMLAFIFRGLRWVLMPILISVTGGLVMTGMLGFLGWNVTVISSNFFSLLLVMTLSVTIHLVVRYRELSQLNPKQDNQSLIVETLKQMSKPCLYTTLTTIAAFASLLISGIRPVIDFGWMMSIGVTIALVLSFVAFASIMSILPQPKKSKQNTDLKITEKLAKFTEKFGNSLIIFILLSSLAAIIGLSKLTVENRFIDYFKESTEINQGLTQIDQNLGGTIPLEIVFNDLADAYWFDEYLRSDIHQLHLYLDSLEETGKVLSADTLMQVLTAANDGDPLNGFFLNIARSQIPESAKSIILDPYLNENNGQLRLVVRVKETNKDLKRAELIKTIQNHITKEMGFKEDGFKLTGMLVLYNNMLQSLFDSQIKTISAVFLIIFIMFLFVFRSFSLSVLAIVPNILPSLFVLGLMGHFNIPLDLMTITISAIAIGIGVDNAIHYIHRFKDEFSKDSDYLKTMYRAHQSIGLAMFYTSITVTLGFLILVLSNFIPSIYFGLFTAIAMLSAVLANLTLLPKLILIFKPRIK